MLFVLPQLYRGTAIGVFSAVEQGDGEQGGR